MGPDNRADRTVELSAPAKLTLSLRVTGVRADGFHLIDSEMVTVDLVDTLVIGAGDGLTVADQTGVTGRADPVPTGPDNLVLRALAAVGRRATVDLVKRVPPGAGLGGGSADAAAILRWAGCTDLEVACGLGADVPFCVRGGRATVRGIGEAVTPLPWRPQRFSLQLAPFGMDTAAVYRAWDEMTDVSAGSGAAGGVGTNDLESAALAVEPRLARWKQRLEDRTGSAAHLAGSGSTWFVEGWPEGWTAGSREPVTLGGEQGILVAVGTTPPSEEEGSAEVERPAE